MSRLIGSAIAVLLRKRDSLRDTARVKRLPTMLPYKGSVAKGALASYDDSYYTLGLLSAKHVQRVLLGANPGDLPVEQLDRLQVSSYF